MRRIDLWLCELLRIQLPFCMVAALIGASPARATDFFWNSPNQGKFNNSVNWTPDTGGPGGAGDTVNFDLGAPTRHIVDNVGGQNGRLLVHNDILQLEVTDYTLLNIHSINPSLVVGVASGDTADVVLNGTSSSILRSEHSIIGDGAGGAGTVRIGTMQWLGNGNLTIGDFGSGELRIQSGAVVSNENGFIASRSGSNGTVAVSGLGAMWTNRGTLRVGGDFTRLEGGTASLVVEAGGSVVSSSAFIGDAQGSSGTVMVRGANSTWTNSGDLSVGFRGEATLTIEDHALVQVGQTLSIDASGALTLNGGTLRFDGYNRTGKFNYIAGTIQLAGDRTFGADAAIDDLFGTARTIGIAKVLRTEGSATLMAPVILDGGTLTAPEVVNAALLDFRRGTLELTSQAVVIEPGGLIGGTLDLKSDQTFNIALGITNRGLVTGDGRIGGPFHNDAGGELRAEPGRSLTLTGAANTNDGQINLFGGLLDFRQDLTNNAGGFISGNGTLRAAGGIVNQGVMNFSGAANVAGDLSNSATGKIIASGGGPTTFFDDVTNDGEIRTSEAGFTVFFGAVTGGGAFTGPGTVNIEGDLSPGSSPAIVRFEGDLVLGAASTTTMELGGADPAGPYDQIHVAGQLNFGGSLTVDLINGFMPSAGDAFDLFNWDAKSGAFTALDLPTLDGGLMWNASQLDAAGVLSVAAAGDYNQNGIVDAADYVLWQDTLGQTGAGLAADGDASGTIDAADYLVWKSNFGAALGSGVATSATHVPEPASLVLFFIAGLCSGRRRAVSESAR